MPDSSNPFEELEQPVEVDDSASQQQEPDTSSDEDAMQGSQPSVPTSQGSSTSSTKGLLGTLDPTVPPTPNDWPKVYQAMKAMEGRVRSTQRAQGQLAPEVQQKVDALDYYLAIPGVQELLGSYFDQAKAKGVQFDIREMFQGQQSAQTAPPMQQKADDEDWLNFTPTKFKSLIRSEMQKIADERARGIVDPLYQQVGSMRFESEMAALQAEGYADLPKFADQIQHILRTNPQMSARDAYGLAKWKAGGFGRPRPNAQAAFSEGAGSRGEASMQVDESEQIARDMMKAGYNGRL